MPSASEPPERRSLLRWFRAVLVPDQSEVSRIVADAHTSPQVLNRIYRRPGTPGHVRLRVLQHPACPPEVLSHAARSRELPKRHCAAQHPHTPVKSLIVLCRDSVAAVAESAARNASTPTKALLNPRLLRFSLRPMVFEELASRPDGAEVVEDYLVEQGFLVERGLIPFDILLAYLPD